LAKSSLRTIDPVSCKSPVFSLRNSIFFMVVAFATLLCTTSSSKAQTIDQQRMTKLDSLIAHLNYDDILRMLYPQTLGQPPLDATALATDFQWLSSQKETDHGPLLYFFSWRMMDVDADVARDYNARGRIEMMLAARQCRARGRSVPMSVILEGEVFKNHMPLRADDAAWAASIDKALKWDASLASHESADWYCGPGGTLPAEQAAAVRADYWQRINDVNRPKLPSS
jgi:hypothetical protein